MRPRLYSTQNVVDLLRKQKVASMSELKEALGTDADATVFRRLAELSYRTSYSHRGRYYTLEDIPKYDDWGLWSFRAIWFSQRGTLLDTIAGLVQEADAGFFAAELESILNVDVKGAILRLLSGKRLSRHKVDGRYLYCVVDRTRSKQQVQARGLHEAVSSPSGPLPKTEVMPDELKAAIVLFFSLLDEKQRRLYAGLESLKVGHGGDRRIADLLGMNAGTVAEGRRQLLARDVEVERVRSRGAGRRAVEKKPRKS